MEGIQLSVWGSLITNVANKLGYKVESYKEVYEKRITNNDIPVGWGTIKAGIWQPFASEQARLSGRDRRC